jgi:D-xylose 1-dehydrogenase (NADP+, D-xylono-1,5-lactone-forming)
VTSDNGGGEGVRWGVLSTARIGEAVVRAVADSPQVDVVAVASRTLAAASSFASELGIPRAHGSYRALLDDPSIEAVYIPLPNGLHVDWTLAALEAGKHVLVEKAFSPRFWEVERCFDCAERQGLVLSEGFMWRHHPQTERLVDLVESGAVGSLRLVRSSFSFPLERPGDVRWDADLDGGALLDVGCYCVSAARLFGGEPERVSGEAVMTPGGVDSRFAGTLRLEGGVVGSFDCGFDMAERDELELVGTEGSLFTDDPWHCRAPLIELRRGGGVERIEVPAANAYRRELEDVSAAIRGRVDGPLLGRADAVGQARALEALLRSSRSSEAVALT